MIFGDPLYTWVDVQAALDGSIKIWPEALFSARAYWDGLTIECQLGEEPQVIDWMAESFGPRWEPRAGGGELRLESDHRHPRRVLSVRLDPLGDRPAPARMRRSFRRPDTALRREEPSVPRETLEPMVFAWHSFKGGVGRTTTAIQFARLLARQPEKINQVLLVDMDFEAPGVTWMIAESRLPAPELSMADILALIHSSSADELPDVLDLITGRLRDSLVEGIMVVPALRPSQREPDIRPEHLETPGIQPLADILAEIGRRMGITHVIADLRAGRSELAASLLLDRRVNRVLVTTPAGQSVKGTEEMMRDLASAFPRADTDPSLTVVVSKVLPGDKAEFDNTKASLTTCIESLPLAGSIDLVFPVRFTAALYDEPLLSLPLDWDQATTRLDQSATLDVRDFAVDLSFRDWVEEVGMRPTGQPAAVVDTDLDIQVLRERLETYSVPLVVAEGSGARPFLDAGFLRKLIESHRTRLPVVVAEGSKGSGKTFTFLRLIAHKHWSQFASAANVTVEVEARVEPLVWPKNLTGPAQVLMDECFASQTNSARERLALDAERDRALSSLRTVTEWREWWIQRMASRLNVATPTDLANIDADTSGLEVPLFVVDGLEDFLPGIHSDGREQMCLRALLQEVPTWLKAHGSAIGLLVFVRSDYIRAAIQQNTEQFRMVYRAFELRWDRTEALRLVDWIARQAQVVPVGASQTDTLIRLWGRKLGNDASREAITDAWVMDALSTHNEEVQARDLVRLIARSANLSRGSTWIDRLLAPHAIRDALQQVGAAKIREILEEYPDLGKALEHFRSPKLAATLRIPFRFSDMSTQEDQSALAQLENAGIAWREGSDIWLVSLYRRGLGLQLQPHRRERVLR